VPKKPTAQNRMIALMHREAVLAGHGRGPAPEVGRRIALKPEVVRQIREMANAGKCCSEIARALRRAESGIRRYAQDYGIVLPKGSVGGPGPRRVRAIERRRAKVQEMLDAGWTQRAIAREMGLSTFTICQDAHYMRARRRKGETA
jgi:hypothetical protein